MLYQDQEAEQPVKKRTRTESKIKYTCPKCEANAWARPSANLVCGDCQTSMLAAAASIELAKAELHGPPTLAVAAQMAEQAA